MQYLLIQFNKTNEATIELFKKKLSPLNTKYLGNAELSWAIFKSKWFKSLETFRGICEGLARCVKMCALLC